MTNGDRGGPLIAELLRRVRRAYEWDSEATPVPRGNDPPITAPTVTVPAERLARYPGRYRDDALDLTVRLEHGALQADAGDGWTPLLALSETEFRLGSSRARFDVDASGAVTGLVVRVSGRDVLLRRQ